MIDELYMYSGELDVTQINNLMNNNLTSINEVGASNGVTVYPNPAKSVVNVTAPEGVTGLTLIGLDGRIILPAQKASSVDVSNVPSGNYILKIENSKGENQFKKVVVMH